MKITTFAISILLPLQFLAQTEVVISTAPGNADQVYYSLMNDVQATVPLTDWDLAFESTGITGGILLNTAKGYKLHKAPYAIADWAILDTTGMAATWPVRYNSTTKWSSGAFNQDLTSNPFDLGWGIYNFTTHNINGDSLFVLMYPDGSFKKLRMDGFTNTNTSFNFTLADLDGSNEQMGAINRNDYIPKNFGYFSLSDMTAMDLEPVSAEWDLLFTKYSSFVPQPVPSYYPVVGVLHNKNVEVVQVDGIPTDLAQWAGEEFGTDMDIIGYDWKTFNQGTFVYEYAEDRTYFVKDRSDNIWKLVFTSYGGGASGNIEFTQELVSATSVSETDAPQVLMVYPNPVSDGQLSMVLDGELRNASVTMLDATGRIVLQERIQNSNALAISSFDVNGLTAGSYVVQLQADGVRATSRFAIQ